MLCLCIHIVSKFQLSVINSPKVITNLVPHSFLSTNISPKSHIIQIDQNQAILSIPTKNHHIDYQNPQQSFCSVASDSCISLFADTMVTEQLVFQPPKFDWHSEDQQQAFEEWKGQIILALTASNFREEIWFTSIDRWISR